MTEKGAKWTILANRTFPNGTQHSRVLHVNELRSCGLALSSCFALFLQSLRKVAVKRRAYNTWTRGPPKTTFLSTIIQVPIWDTSWQLNCSSQTIGVYVAIYMEKKQFQTVFVHLFTKVSTPQPSRHSCLLTKRTTGDAMFSKLKTTFKHFLHTKKLEQNVQKANSAV